VETSVFLRGLAIGFGIAAPAATSKATRRGPGLLTAWATTFALTVTNPTTILSFAAIFAGLGLGGGAGGSTTLESLRTGARGSPRRFRFAVSHATRNQW
jgi:hypothetical protein